MREASRIAYLSVAVTLGLLMSSCSDPAVEDVPASEEPGAVRGFLRSATADYFDENRSEKLYALQRKDGTLLSLQFSGRPEVRPGSEILVWGAEQVDGLHVERVKVLSDNDNGGIGSQRSNVIDPTPLSPPIKAAFVSLSAAYTNDMLQARKLRDDFIKQTMEVSSYGRWTMEFDVFGPYSIPNDCGGSFYSNIGTNGVAAMKAAGVDTDQYQQIQFLLGTTFTSCSWGGFGLDGHTPIRTDGQRGQYNPWSYVKADGQGVMVQEIGHNWGLAHVHFCPNTQTPTPSCSGYSEYGSPFTPMSNGSQVYLNSWERIQMNFFSGCNVVTVGTNGVYDIGSINLACNGPQVLRIKADLGTDAQRYYYFEYRTPVGIDKTNGVLVHYSADIKQGGWTKCDWGGPDCPEDWIISPIGSTAKEGLLTTGAAWTTPQGVDIKILDVGATAKFQFTFPTQGDAPTCLEGGPWDNQQPVCKGSTGVDGGGGSTTPDAGRSDAGGTTDSGNTGGQAGTGGSGGATGGTGGSTGGTAGATAGSGGSSPDSKGCGCRVPGGGAPGGLSAFAATAALGIAARWRRRPRRDSRS